MLPIKCILVDDEPKLILSLEDKIKRNCPFLQIVSKVHNIEDAKIAIEAHKPQLLFLDINLPGGSGLSLLEQYNKQEFEVIFVTGYNRFVLEAMRLSAVDYLLKPVDIKELVAAVAKAKKRIENKEKIELYELLRHNLKNTSKQLSRIAIPGVSEYDYIEVSRIIRCQGWQKYTRIYLSDGIELVSSYNIGVFKDLLEPFDFYCTHRSHLINQRYILKYKKEGVVVMKDDSEVPISRRKKDDFIENVLLKQMPDIN